MSELSNNLRELGAWLNDAEPDTTCGSFTLTELAFNSANEIDRLTAENAALLRRINELSAENLRTPPNLAEQDVSASSDFNSPPSSGADSTLNAVALQAENAALKAERAKQDEANAYMNRQNVNLLGEIAALKAERDAVAETPDLLAS